MGCGASNSSSVSNANNLHGLTAENSASIAVASRPLLPTKPYRHGAVITQVINFFFFKICIIIGCS
jgi:hypothetical protein